MQAPKQQALEHKQGGLQEAYSEGNKIGVQKTTIDCMDSLTIMRHKALNRKPNTMPRKIDSSEVKMLQIPVKAVVAEQIAKYGARFSKSQAQFALKCLELAIADWENSWDRISKGVVKALGTLIPRARSLRKRANEEMEVIRLQVPVPHSCIESLEQIGVELNLSPVQAAGWLLERIILDEGWLVAMLGLMVKELGQLVDGLQKGKASKSPSTDTRP